MLCVASRTTTGFVAPKHALQPMTARKTVNANFILRFNDSRFILCAAQHTPHTTGTKSGIKAPAAQGIKCRWTASAGHAIAIGIDAFRRRNGGFFRIPSPLDFNGDPDFDLDYRAPVSSPAEAQRLLSSSFVVRALSTHTHGRSRQEEDGHRILHFILPNSVIEPTSRNGFLE